MNRSLLPLSVALLNFGCSEFDLKSAGDGDGDQSGDCAPQILLQPAEINFGQLKVVDGVSNTQSVQITNEGNCTLELDDIYLDGDTLNVYSMGSLSTPVLEPGAIASVAITFAPVTDATNEARILVESNDPDDPIAGVKLIGDGIAPLLDLSPTEYDFGRIFVGCEVIQPITITNVGRDDLLIDSFSHNTQSIDFSFDAYEYIPSTGAEANGALPWTLGPDDSVDVYISYYPLDEFDDDSYLFVYSNDPFTPEALAQQEGDGELYGENTDIFEQPLQAETDIVFAVDKSCSMGDDIANVIANFQSYTGTLEGLDADYRVAAVVQDNGSVSGSAAYISKDNADDGIQIITEMLGGSYGGSTEMAFTLFYNAMGTGSNRPGNWVREDAKLNLVGVSDEPEQSTMFSWDGFVDHFQSLKSDPDDLVMHAIGGDYPSGCATAEPYTNFYEATVATDGLFLSICASDFASNLTELAEQSAAALNIFDLTLTPVPETIVVEVNGVPDTNGWRYEEEGNAVVFDEDNIPEGGSIVEIDYVIMSDCDF